MPLTIGTNIASLRTQRGLSESTSNLSKIFERLSSGQRINSASDDAAGLAVASTLNADARLVSQSLRNINDGISALSIVDSALSETTSILERLEELSIQAANGSYSDAQRSALDDEAQALKEEFARIVATTEFNGTNLLTSSNASINIQAGIGGNGQLNAQFRNLAEIISGLGTYTNQSINGPTAPPVGTPAVGGAGVVSADFNGDGIDDAVSVLIGSLTSAGNQIYLQYASVEGNSSGTYSLSDSGSLNSSLNGITSGISIDVIDYQGDGDLDVLFSFTGTGGYGYLVNDGTGNFTHTALTSGSGVTASNAGVSSIEGDYNGDGVTDNVALTYPGNRINMQMQTQDTESTITAEPVELGTFSLSTAVDASSALATISTARELISGIHGRLGASLSRLEAASTVNAALHTEFSAAASRIMDADIAEETAKLVQQNILREASAAVLAQANQQPSLVLSLLE